jgi:penicillin-binding protein 1A
MASASERSGEQSSPNSPYLQGAFVAMDPRTGAVRALVGGRDFDDSKFNRATQALRQPGSTFKPIVYASAVQNGRPPTYIVDDSPVMVPQSGGGSWTPQNYDGKFEGPMPMRRGLYQSRNIVAIKVGMELGPSTVIDMARKFGVTTPIPPYPSIYIGAADVYPIEMIAAYSAFATLGTRVSPNGIVRVENAKGDILWEPTPSRTPVMTPEEAWLMVSMMKDVVQRGTAAGSVGSQFRIPAGGKTGTTNDGNDVWFVGYTSDLVAGVWMGLDKPRKIKGNAQGGVLAAPAWTAFMREVYRRKPASPDWPRPEGIVERQVDLASGQLWAPGCGEPVTDYFLAGTDPIATCIPSVTPGVTTPGAPAQPGTTPVDTSFGFPPPKTPAPRPDTTLTRTSGGTVITPGAAPTPRTSRPRPSRDTVGTSTPRDTSNPFTLPPTQRR